MYPDVERIARRRNPVFDFDDARYRTDCIGNLRRQFLESGFIIRKNLDLDGLWHTGEVTDQVFHELGRFDRQARNVVFDLRAQVIHYLLKSSSLTCLQADEEVALVCLVQIAAKTQTSAPGISLDLRQC